MPGTSRARRRAHRREAAAAAQRIHVRPDGFARAPEPDPHLGELQRAVIDGLRVRAVYRPRGGAAAERTLDPVGLVHAGQAWYLMALRDGERRTYKTSRFTSVSVLDEPARRPADVDLAAEFEESRASFRSGHEAVLVELRADEYGWTKLSGFGTVVTPPGPDGAGTLGFSDIGRAVWTLWSALPHVDVLGPPEVRAALAARLAETAAVLGAG